MKRDILYLIAIVIMFILCLFQTRRLVISRSEANMYDYLLSNAAGILPVELRDTTNKAVKTDSLFGKGIYLVATLSPKDCPVCLEREVKFLKVLHKEIPALPIRLIIAYYPSKEEIGPWLKEWALEFPYYFDRGNTFEGLNHLNSSSSWNILMRSGRIITSFLPEENHLAKQAIFTFIIKYIRHIE